VAAQSGEAGEKKMTEPFIHKSARIVGRSAFESNENKYIAKTEDGRFFMFENEARNGEMFHENAFELGELVTVRQDGDRYEMMLPYSAFTVIAEPFEIEASVGGQVAA
jgi:hypothetical protein